MFLDPELEAPKHQECEFDIPKIVEFKNYEDRNIMNIVFKWENEI